MSAMKFDFV